MYPKLTEKPTKFLLRKPSVPYNIYDDALMMIDPATGLINFRKLSETPQIPYLKFIKDEDDKGEEKK